MPKELNTDFLSIERMERLAEIIMSFNLLEQVRKRIGELQNDGTGGSACETTGMRAIVNEIVNSESANHELDQMNTGGIGLSYYVLSEEKAQEGARILEWFLGINSVVPSYFLKYNQNTPIFLALTQIHKLFTTEKIYEEDSEGIKNVIRIDEFSISIFLIALEANINHLECAIDECTNLNCYEGYLTIMRAYHKYLEDSTRFN